MERYKWTNTEYPKDDYADEDVLLWVYDHDMKVGYPWIDLATYCSEQWTNFDGEVIETDILEVKCWMFLDKGRENFEYPETFE